LEELTMSTQQDARETAIVDALDWIKRGASGLEPEAFYRAVDDPAVVHAASTEGAAQTEYSRTYREEFAATVRQSTRAWPG